MDILCVISRFLDYPDVSLLEGKEEAKQIIFEANINPDLKQKMQKFVDDRLALDLLDWQSEYDGLFERGRSLGLWLFEHVHGESRARGQAMVDLMEQYKQAGLEISQHELPDYVPLFLEFVATQGDDNAQSWLQDVEHVLALLQVRLEKRESNYSVLFEVLQSIAGCNVDMSEIKQQAATEQPDNTKEALDKEWEEEEVTFGEDSLEKNCDGARRKPSENQRADLDVPLNWVDFDAGSSSANQDSSQATIVEPSVVQTTKKRNSQ